MKQLTNFNNHHFNDEIETHIYIKPKDLREKTDYTITGVYWIKNCKYPHYNIKCIDTDDTRFFVSVPASLEDTIADMMEKEFYDDVNNGKIFLRRLDYISKKYGKCSTIAIYNRE